MLGYKVAKLIIKTIQGYGGCKILVVACLSADRVTYFWMLVTGCCLPAEGRVVD